MALKNGFCEKGIYGKIAVFRCHDVLGECRNPLKKGWEPLDRPFKKAMVKALLQVPFKKALEKIGTFFNRNPLKRP